MSLVVRPNYDGSRRHLLDVWWEGREGGEPYGPKTALCGHWTHDLTANRKANMAQAPMCKRCEAIAAKEPPHE